MTPLNLNIKFNPEAFAREFISRGARRWLNNFFEQIGLDNIAYLLQSNKNIVSYIPPKQLLDYRVKAAKYKDYAKLFSDDDIYSWLPDDCRALIESYPQGQGKEWVYRQFKHIRELMFSS